MKKSNLRIVNTNTENIFASLQGVSLKDLEEVALMSRIDNKYVFPYSQLGQIIDAVREEYNILEIENKKLMRYSTLYYDTHDFSLYRMHHRGKLNRYKIRERTYLDTGISFIEVKYKTNQLKTIKTRTQVEEIDSGFDTKKGEFISDVSNIDAQLLEPKLWVNYQRATLVSKAKNERATIDIGLQYEFNERKKKFEDLVIIETKRESSIKSTPMMAALKLMQIRPEGFSKYCMGITQLYPNIKQNSFKKKILRVEKLQSGITESI